MDAARLFVRVTVAGADAAQSTLKGLGAQVNATQSNLNRISGGAGQVVRGLTRVGVATAALAAGGLTYAARQAIAFEDAFAGVEKTVGKAAAASAGIDQALRKLSTRIPINYQDLAGIAQEAGALGVPAEKVANFTEVVSRLSAATVGLTREAAAEAFGKLGNVLGLNADKTGLGYERLASSLIRLGNTAASSEGDIIEVAKRFGAAGTQAGLSGDKILGFASAIASLGVEPEAAGSALSRTFNKITTQIGTSDAKFKVLARTSGMTAAEFKKAWATDAAGAFQTFLTNLSKLDKFQAADVLKKAGISNVRDVNLILLLSQNLDLLTSSLHDSADAWKENTEWQTVSDTRFATLQNSLIKFHNQIQVTAAAVGEQFTPALGRALDKLSAFINTHQSDLVQIGKDVGKAIDDIDWSEVERGALAVADAAKSILTVLSKIPVQIDLAVAAFLGLNKVTGGAGSMIVGGATNIVGGALSGLAGFALRGAGNRVGGRAGSILGALGATPVYITGVAPGVALGGLGGGGGLPGVGGAGGGGILGTLAKGLGVVTIGAISVEAATTIARAAGEAFDPALMRAIDDPTGAHGVPLSNRDPRRFNAAGQVVTNVGTSGREPAGLANPILDRGGREAGAGTLGTAIARAVSSIFKDATDRVVAIQRKAWADFAKDAAALKQANTPAEIQKAVNAVVRRVEGGQGNVAGTTGILNSLKTQLRNTHDPTTARILRDAIGKVERRVVGREFVQRQLDAANKIANSTGDAKKKLADLEAIQKTLRDRGDTHAANTISKSVNAAKSDIALAARWAGRVTRDAINAKQLAVTVKYPNVTFSAHFNILESIATRQTWMVLGGSKKYQI